MQENNNIVSYVGAKAILRNKNGEVLIVKENWSKWDLSSGKWGLPGGRIQESEMEIGLADCLLREIKEELGDSVEISVENYFDSFFRFLEKTKVTSVKHAFAIIFICKFLSGEIKLQELELDEFMWVNKETYENYEYVSGYKKVLDKYFKK